MLYTGYVYIIRNKVNDKVYIGQTTQEPGRRFKDHLKNNSKCTKLARAIKKYGKENFYEDPKKLFVICSSSLANVVKKLNYYETFYIKLYNSVKKGYNCNYGGDNHLRDDSELKYGTRDRNLMVKLWAEEYYSHEENRQKHNERAKNYYKENKEQVSIKAKNYRNTHKEKIKQSLSDYRKNHREENIAYQKEYRKTHKEELHN